MIRIITAKIFSPIQTVLNIRQRKKFMQKMMAYHLKTNPNKLCAAYKCEVTPMSRPASNKFSGDFSLVKINKRNS
jgi:hypothetical protein